MASLAANFWIISSGLMPRGGAEFRDPDPSSQLVSANRAAGSKKAKQTIVIQAPNLVIFIGYSPGDLYYQTQSVAKSCKTALSNTGRDVQKNLDWRIHFQEVGCAVLPWFLLYSFPHVLLSSPPNRSGLLPSKT